MSTKSATTSSAADTLKLLVAIILVAGGIFGYNYFSDQYIEVVRVIGLLVVGAVAAVIASQTEKGRTLLVFGRDANVEVRKVVWPTRAETIQTTLVVIFVVILVGIFLWLVDMFFGWAVRSVLGNGG